MGNTGGHKLVHNAVPRKGSSLLEYLVKCTGCSILQSGEAAVETISLEDRKLSGLADSHNFGRISSKR